MQSSTIGKTGPKNRPGQPQPRYTNKKGTNMDKTLTTSIALMAISGLTFLAYKHPKGYNKLFPFILGLVFVVMTAVYSWDGAVHATTLKLTNYLKPDKSEEAIKSIKDLLLSSGSFSLFSTGFMLYMSFLLFLPNIIEHRDDKKPE